MKKRNILAIILILLMMICAMGYIFTLANNDSETNNALYNNSTNPQLNKSVDKNATLNNTALSNDENSVNDNLNNKYYAPLSSNSYEINKKDSNDTNDSYEEAMEAKRGVEKYVLNKNEIAGYPTFKDKDGSWLVPIFDKKTKKFIGSVYIYGGGSLFVMGPQFYSEYKDIISGKTAHKVDNNEYKYDVVEDVPDYSMRYVLAASNPDVSNNSDFMISDQVVLDNYVFPEEDQMPIIESDCELNSSS